MNIFWTKTIFYFKYTMFQDCLWQISSFQVLYFRKYNQNNSKEGKMARTNTMKIVVENLSCKVKIDKKVKFAIKLLSKHILRLQQLKNFSRI
jgi:hypothetical protein